MRVLLVDADVGTGGLSYYLGFSAFLRAREGLTEYVAAGGTRETRMNVASAHGAVIELQPAFREICLLPVGEHRMFYKQKVSLNSEIFANVISIAREQAFQAIIIDCRGGIDEESLAVCRAVDEILIVVETDAASIQSSQHLVNVLSEQELGGKVAGFVLNKVMDDPSSLAKAGTSFFRAEYLGSIPFDIEATRDFIKGNIPKASSLFCNHVFRVTAKLFPPAAIFLERYPILKAYEFGTVTLKNPDIRYGTAMIASSWVMIAVYVAIGYAAKGYLFAQELFAALLGLTFFGLISLSDTFKEAIGRVLKVYVELVRRVLRVRSP